MGYTNHLDGILLSQKILQLQPTGQSAKTFSVQLLSMVDRIFHSGMLPRLVHPLAILLGSSLASGLFRSRDRLPGNISDLRLQMLPLYAILL